MKKIFKFLTHHHTLLVIIAAVPAFIFGARLYETGYMGLRGSTVLISGSCQTVSGQLRSDLLNDQVLVTYSDNQILKGMIRETRESLTCKFTEISVDKFGAIKDFGFKLKEIPKIVKFVPEKIKILKDYSELVNNTFVISGTCKDTYSNRLEPFLDKVVSITTVKRSGKDPSIVYFFGIRRDTKTAVVCESADITYKKYTEPPKVEEVVVEEPKVEEPLSYIGKKVKLTGYCLPDKRIKQKETPFKYFNLTKTDVEVIEEKIDEDGTVKYIAASILSKIKKKVYNKDKEYEISLLGQKITCDGDVYPIVILDIKEEIFKRAKKGGTNEKETK